MFKTIIIGNLVNDPILRNHTYEDGRVSTFANFRIAANHKSKTYFANVTCFDGVTNKMGTNVAAYLTKGREVMIEGICTASAVTKDGKVYANLNVIAETIEFLRGRPAAEAMPAPAAEAADAQQAPAVAAAPIYTPAPQPAPAPAPQYATAPAYAPAAQPARHSAPANYTPAPAQVAQMPSPNPRRNQPLVTDQEFVQQMEAQMASELPF